MGILVALSGLDGSGKTTQGKLIKELCITNGIKAHYVHLKTIDTKEVYFKVRESFGIKRGQKCFEKYNKCTIIL